jgi:toxin ParE1/3/4
VRRLRLSRAARDSLAGIAGYIASASASRELAEAFVSRLRAQCERLAALPGTIGRPRPELGDDLRSFPFRGFVIVFRYQTTTLDIVDILHGHQDIDAHFSEE